MPYEDSGDLYMLVDKYGRVLVQHFDDGDYYQAIVWSDTRFDWDSMAEPELLEVMNDRGYVEALTIAENLNVTVNIGAETETYVWNAAKAEFDHDFDFWANGERTLALKWFQRESGSPFCAVVDDNSGGPITWNDQSGQGRCLVLLNPGEEIPEFGFELLSQYPELEQDVAGLYEITCYESPVPGYIGVNTFVDDTGDNIFVMNISDDGAYTESSAQLPVPPGPPAIIAQIWADNAGSVIPTADSSPVYIHFYGPLTSSKQWIVNGQVALKVQIPSGSNTATITYGSSQSWGGYVSTPITVGKNTTLNGSGSLSGSYIRFYDDGSVSGVIE